MRRRDGGMDFLPPRETGLPASGIVSERIDMFLEEAYRLFENSAVH